jgi:hypothetical protein
VVVGYKLLYVLQRGTSVVGLVVASHHHVPSIHSHVREYGVSET